MQDFGFDTLALHAGQTLDPATGARAVPLYQTTSYVFKSAEHAADLFALKEFGNIYTRLMNPTTDVFEKRMAALEGGSAALAVASGMAAISSALLAITGMDDEIVAGNNLYGGTYQLFHHAFPKIGRHVRFVDSRQPAEFRQAITPRTRAIMPVSLYGQCADMDAIHAIAARHGHLPVIEDAAQSLGAQYRGRESGNLSTFGCTSFFPSKPLGCYGDGGAIFTSDDALAQACREIRVHGQSKRYTHTRVGVGGRMDTLQCAIVLAKLERFDWEVQQRMALGDRYNQLCDAAGIARMAQREDRTSVFAQYTVRVANRAQVQDRLKAAGIPTAVHYPIPLNRQPAYLELCSTPTPVADQLAAEVMSLPMSADLPPAQQDAVVQALQAAQA